MLLKQPTRKLFLFEGKQSTASDGGSPDKCNGRGIADALPSQRQSPILMWMDYNKTAL